MMAAPLPATELRGVPPSGLCSVDTVDGRYFEGGMLGVAGSNAVRIRGWFGEAGDDGAPRPVGPFRIVLADLAGAWAIPSRTGAPRPDAADYFEEPAMGTAGFAQLSDLSAMPPATYRVLLLSGSRDAPSACDSGKRLELR